MAKPHGMGRPTMTKPAELYACLYAKEFPAQAMLRLRPELRHQPCVVMEGEPPLQYVRSRNAKAHRLGIAHGMTQVEIATFPSVTVLLRSKAEEVTAKAVILECAGAFSPRVQDCGNGKAFLCVVDIAGTESLFGPPKALAKSLLERINALGIAASIAVSGNFHAAVCIARGRSARTSFSITASGEERGALSPLPLSVLDLSEEHAETFSLWGIRTLGMLAELPEKALIARMGQEGKRLRRLACGELPHLFLPVEPDFTLEERMELDNPVELLDSLLFVVGVMLEQLIVRATGRIFVLASVTILLSLEGGTSHSRTVKPALPTNDRQLWIKLIHLDLEAHPPQAAILSLALTAEPGSTSKVQLGLFSPQLPEPGRLDVTLARIRAIVGENAVGRAALKDTHQPDGFRMEPFVVPSASPVAVPLQSRAIAAMRQIRPAENVPVTLRAQRPESFFFRGKRYVVEQGYGPWVMSGEWWNPTRWSLQQWDLVASSHDGSLLCCCLTYERTQNSWQVVALYD
jgi:protein ImuB